MLKRYHKVRWLSRYQALSALCDSLESVLSTLQDNANDNGEGGYLKALGTHMRGSKFLSIDIEWSRFGSDLEEAIVFKKHFAQACVDALKEKFVDNDVVGAFHILSPSNMPSKMVKLRDWGQGPMEILCLNCDHMEFSSWTLAELSLVQGKISFKNLKRVAKALGENMTNKELQEMIDEADRDGDGEIIAEEFYKIMKMTSLS
ncbi:hypothetical protein R1flu_029312 [Riccia fluitans]|uniref:EF-hand domain-containing protein n=1 Tax=Riccia fluitans TaxID=41844 RepID=A0ABD1XPP4_9MARC